ncbi:hypothetical protein LWC34_17545 [Kibdelosporangium philippinense]|uniref:Uncharacterized protein n=1 Tax=Kibdelosporangium philippinense TaxID=211113 RepID=A0ABS8ZCP0_9PSEU|nr:hypothetical protein [Kibdelosporangium philippinense]MCE7004615.1 hypothetical protein [Kibdelosporangium philippinense]
MAGMTLSRVVDLVRGAASALFRRSRFTMMFWYGNGMSGWGYELTTVSTILSKGLVIWGTP